MLYPSSYYWLSPQNKKKNYFKFLKEPKKSPYSQENSKQKEQNWKHHTTWFQTILQSYSNQNRMVLVPKQPYRQMKHNRDIRNNTAHLQASDLQWARQKQTMVKGFPIKYMVLGKLASHMQKTESTLFSYTL